MPEVARRYIAYGSNMCRTQMAVRCPSARVLGVSELPGWRFAINRLGFATLIPDSAARAYGMVWSLDAIDEGSLDRYEAVAEGEYIKAELDLAEHGAALIYLATDPTPGIPIPAYLEIILAAAAAADLPQSYQVELAGWRSR